MSTPLALVVDDDPDIRMLVEISMSRVGGWRVISTDRGRTAIDLAREHRPTVVLMDVMMPEMDGVEAAGILLDDPETADIPVVLLTARATVGNEAPPWSEIAIRGTIAKPFSPRTLAQEVAALIGWEDAASTP